MLGLMSAGEFALLTAQFQWKVTLVNINSTTPAQLCGRDATRWSVTFSSYNSRLLVSPLGSPLGIASLPFEIAAYTFGNPTVILNFQTYGSLVQEAWQGLCSSGTDQCGVVEVFYRPSPSSVGINPGEGI